MTVRSGRARFSLTLGILALTVFVPPASAAFTCGSWEQVTSQSAGSDDNEFHGVAASAPTDVWAVGYQMDGSDHVTTLIDQSTGGDFTTVNSPNTTKDETILNGVDARSASDAWAVGFSASYSKSLEQAFIARWNGASWKSSKPAAVKGQAVLNAVTITSAKNAWAVGTAGKTLIEHWNGLGWSRIKSPSVGRFGNWLNGVVSISKNDVWAVGGYDTSSGGSKKASIALHWNGTQWSIKKTPALTDGADLLAVSGGSSSDVWAVGRSGSASLIEHWDGSSWKRVTSPNPGSSGNQLTGVSLADAANIWAVGEQNNGGGNSNLVMRYDGLSWVTETVPNPVSNDQLSGVSATSATDVWSSGFGNGLADAYHRC